jgi:PRTRC genetic system protein A
MDAFSLVQHHIVKPDGTLPDMTGCLYAYVLGGNGVFVHAQRPGLKALIPVSSCRIAGLPELTPQVNIARGVPAKLLLAALHWSQKAFPNEALFWFNLGQEWSVYMPAQRRGRGRVVPLDPNDSKGTSALVDLHSHAGMSPFFSPADDQDERGFRLYAVLGNLHKMPTIRVRVGVYSHFYYLPASTVFELPEGILDIHTAFEKEISTHDDIEQRQPLRPQITPAAL